MNKAHLTNLISAILLLAGYLLGEAHLLAMGSYALSGAVTNHIAIHMLFEKIPGLYGSGVIEERFEEFKAAIKSLMMRQFFSNEQLDRFVEREGEKQIESFHIQSLIEKIDLDVVFQNLVDGIMRSEVGSMVGMLGGANLLNSFKPKFEDTLKNALGSPRVEAEVKSALLAKWHEARHINPEAIEAIIDTRLEELTPKAVKQMVQDIIHQHLGWLVVWGGIFGGLIGLAMSALA